MSNSDPDRIRENIELTRAELGEDVDALTNKVSPSKIAGRQTARVRDAVGRARDRVMGATPSTDDVKEKTAELSQQAKQKAEGNPLAVGLIAFGAGLLAASLIPASATERHAATKMKDAAAPVVDELKDAAKDTANHLKAPAQDAAANVKNAATQAGAEIKGQAQGAASDLKDQAQGAAAEVREQQ